MHLADGFGIGIDILGLSLAAVGSSFPNLVASISVAKMGKSDMAIANALGSNIQNVFLALGIPWTMRTAVDYFDASKPADQKALVVAAAGLAEGVMFMAVTLILLVLF